MGRLTEKLGEMQADYEAQIMNRLARCKLRFRPDYISVEDWAEMAEAMANPRFSHPVISRLFAELGLQVNSKAIQRHRLGECACWKR